MKTDIRHATLIIASLSLLTPTSLFSKVQVLDLANSKLSALSDSTTTSERRLVYNSDGLTMNYDFKKIFFKKIASETGGYELSLPGFTPTMGEGLPSVPGRVDIYSIPTGYEVDLEINQFEYQDIHGDVSPSIPVLSDSEKTPLKIAKIKDYNGFYPESPVTIQSIKTFNGQQLIYVNVCPAQYNKKEGIIRVYSNLSYDLKYQINLTDNEAFRKDNNLLYDSYSNLFNVAGIIPLIEHNNTSETSNKAKQSISSAQLERQTPYYLIVTTTALLEPANKFADWKRSQGYEVKVLSRQEWLATSTVQSRIKSYFQSYPGKYYCLFLGDTKMIPAFVKDDGYDGHGQLETYTTDLPYFCLSGDDYLPEMNYGRLPAKTLDEANTMIDKIINYELNPPYKSSFYKSAAIISVFEDWEDQSQYFTPSNKKDISYSSDELLLKASTEVSDGYEDRRYCQTANEIAEYLKDQQHKTVDKLFTYNGLFTVQMTANPTNWSMLFDFGGILPNDLRNGNHNWDPDFHVEEFKKSLNSGRVFVLYRGHGLNNVWDYILINDNILRKSNNGSCLPVIFAIACQTGANGGEYMPNAGLANNNGGCVAYIGSSGDSYTGPNEPLAHGITNAFWPNPGLSTYMRYVSNDPDEPDDCIPYYPTASTPVYELFDALQAGLLREEQVFFSSVILNDKHREKYEIFGDPSMMLYTEDPYSTGNGRVAATVTRTADTVNIQTQGRIGYISFYDTSTKKVKSFTGSNSASFTTNSPESVIVTVRTPNRPLYINKGSNVNVKF